MARTFNGTSDKITFSLGAGGSLTGAVTLAAIIVGGTATSQAKPILQIGNANPRWSLALNNNPQIVVINNGAGASNGTTTVPAGACLVAASRAAGAGVTPRLHIYDYSTNTWTHENGSATQSDVTPSGNTYIGVNGTTNNRFFNSDIAVGGAWAANFTDAQIESLASDLNAWFQISPNGLWLLDQSSTSMNVIDLTGNGANQSGITGTSVSTNSVPVFSYGAPIVIERISSIATVTGSSATTEANDTSTASGGFGPSGTSTTTNANDTGAGSGTFTPGTQYPTDCAILTAEGLVLLTAEGERLILTECTTITPPAVGSGRPANPRALADAQARRRFLALDDEEILVLL